VKHDDVNIGGIETGPVRFRFSGDEEAAKGLVGDARILLGDFKKYIQNHGMPDKLYQHEFENPNGSRILIKTILGSDGYEDRDEALIVVPFVPIVKQGGRRCIGYIVQGIASEGLAENKYYQFYDFSIETPTGKRLGYDADSGSIFFTNLFNAPTPHFPDNDAKYFPRNISDFQEVITSVVEYKNTYTAFGAYQYTLNGFEILPPLNSDFEWIDSNTDPNLTYTARDGTVITEDHIPVYAAQPISSSVGGHTPWEGTGLTQNQWETQVGNYNQYIQATVAVRACNEALIANYNYDLTHLYADTIVTDYRYVQSHATDSNGTTFDKGYRRKDDCGFIINTGLRIDKGFELTSRAETHGDGTLFMVPSSTSKIFRYSTAIFNENNTSSLQTRYLSAGIGAGFPIDPSAGYAVVDPRNYNIIDNYEEDHITSAKFGVPIKVESGTHRVKIRRDIQDSFLKTKISVWLLFENEGFRRIDFDDQSFASDKFELGKIFEIRVGEIINNIDDFSSLVTMKNHMPEQ